MTKPFTFAIFLLGILIVQIACEAQSDDESDNDEFNSALETSGQPKSTHKAPWILPGFNKTLNKKGKKCWKSTKYHVCFTKHPDTTKLYWKNKDANAEVEMEISNKDGDVVQNWKYRNADVHLSLKEDGSAIQEWKFGASDKLQVTINSKGKMATKWFGNRHARAVEKFKKFINSWCDNNFFFVDKESCVIYDGTYTNIAPWILSGFSKSRISVIGKKGSKCWENDSYHVCLTKSPKTTKLYWKNKELNAEVQMEIHGGGKDISQTWKYEDADVQLSSKADGTLAEEWKFGSSDKLQVNKYSDGTSKAKWVGSKHREDVENFKEFIHSWCEYNDYFIGKENCLIYHIPNTNNDPAWILKGFDQNQVSEVNDGRKCWQDVEYDVCFTKNQSEKKLSWNNINKARVNMYVSSGGVVSQEWSNELGFVRIFRDEDGSVEQTWYLGMSSTLEIKKVPGEAAESKWDGVEDSAGLKKYQEFIDAWCENNDVFVTRDECLMYKI